MAADQRPCTLTGLQEQIAVQFRFDAIIVLDQAAGVVDADVIAKDRSLAFPVPVDSHAVQPETSLIIMGIIVLKNRGPRRSPVRIKSGPIILE